MEWKQNILTAVAMAVVFVLVFKVSLWFMGVPLLIGTIGCVHEARERMRNDPVAPPGGPGAVHALRVRPARDGHSVPGVRAFDG